jgi:hypothetical protein
VILDFGFMEDVSGKMEDVSAKMEDVMKRVVSILFCVSILSLHFAF